MVNKDNVYYTYLHLNADNKPIYVGKGKKDRAYAKRNYPESYTVKIVHDKISETQALEFEEFLIQEIGIDNLYNKYQKGCLSSNLYYIDYGHFKDEIKRIAKLPPKQIRKYVGIIIDDAITGNNIALSFYIKYCPKDILLKIKGLIQQNSVGILEWQTKNN